MDEINGKLEELFKQSNELVSLIMAAKGEHPDWRMAIVEYHVDTVVRNLDSALWAGKNYLYPKE